MSVDYIKSPSRLETVRWTGAGARRGELVLTNSIVGSASAAMELLLTPNFVSNYTRTNRNQGGYYSASFDVHGSFDKLYDFYSRWPMKHVEEYDLGGQTQFEGFINKMTLYGDGFVRSQGLDDVFNRVNVSFTTPNGGTSKKTGWAIYQDSVDLYGRREAMESRSNVQGSHAAYFRDFFLREHRMPHQYIDGFDASARPLMQVEVLGYVFSLNFRYYNDNDALEYNLSDIFTDVVNESEFISSYGGYIESNTKQRAKSYGTPVRGYDVISELAQSGDTFKAPYQFGVYKDREAHYTVLPSTSRYYSFGSTVQLSASGGKVPDNEVLPGEFLTFSKALRDSEKLRSGDDAQIWERSDNVALLAEVSYSDGGPS